MEVADDHAHIKAGDYGNICTDSRTDKSINNVISKFEEYRANGFLCDYTVVSSDGISFPAHKLVLCARSNYFLKYIENDPYATHELKSIPSKIFSIILNFFYTGQIRAMDPMDAMHCWESAIKLRIPFVIDFCAEILKENTNISNCVDVLLKAVDLKSERLVKHCVSVIQKNFKPFLEKQNDLLRLPGDILTRLLSLRTLDADEDDVFRAFCLWREANSNVSQSVLESVFDCIIMDRLSQNSLRHIVKAQCNQKCYAWCIDKALDLHGNTQIEHALPRRLDDTLTLINNFKKTCLGYYDVQTQSWYGLDNTKQMDPNTCPLSNFEHCNEKQNVIFDNEIVLVSGGMNSAHEALNSTWIYRTDKKQWSEGPPLNRARNSHHGCKFRDYFYVIGGYGAKESVERFRFNRNIDTKWEKVRSLNEGRLLHCSASLKIDGLDHLVVFGGCNESMSNTVEAYNYLKGEWNMLAPMNYQRIAALHGVHKNKFYIFSMTNEVTRNAECYDPSTNQWSMICDMDFFPLYGNLLIIDDIFYGFCKLDSSNTVGVISYNSMNNSWRVVNKDGPVIQPSLVLHKLTGYKIETNYFVCISQW